MNIQIDKEPFATTYYYAGAATNDEDEINFTIITNNDEISDEFVLEVQLIDCENMNIEIQDAIISLIKEEFNKLT